uniref:Putative secreted protein n=1 Tax=Anopheles darlingi TaxID=43151 RepID=A0A2M4DHN4_ANODA
MMWSVAWIATSCTRSAAKTTSIRSPSAGFLYRPIRETRNICSIGRCTSYGPWVGWTRTTNQRTTMSTRNGTFRCTSTPANR